MRLLLKALIFLIVFIGLPGWWITNLSGLLPEEVSWCKEYRPDLSAQECKDEFGY